MSVARRPLDTNGRDPKYVVFLAMMGAGAAAVVFLLGVMVGRGESILDIITGYGGVSASASVVEPLTADTPPAIASTTRSEPLAPSTEGGGFSYPQRIGDDEAPDLDGGLGSIPSAARGGEADAAATPAPAESRGGGYAIRRTGGFTVQVTNLRESAAAERMAQRLIEKEYPAFVVAPQPNVPVAVFRVRVGPYPNREEAEQIVQRLEREESLKPWITR